MNSFLEGNRSLATREKIAYFEALETVKSVRYAATLWASTRRNGEYSGLNIVHLIGVGAAQDAHQRSDSWFKALDAFLNSLKADTGPRPCDTDHRSDRKRCCCVQACVYRSGAGRRSRGLSRTFGPSARVASLCSGMGAGTGFKMRVAARLEKWFASKNDLKEKLEDIVNSLWEQTVVAPLRRLVEEEAPERVQTAHVVHFPDRKSA